jgi:hypothetical protein
MLVLQIVINAKIPSVCNFCCNGRDLMCVFVLKMRLVDVEELDVGTVYGEGNV